MARSRARASQPTFASERRRVPVLSLETEVRYRHEGSTMTSNSLIRIAAATIILLQAASPARAASCSDSIGRVQAQLDAAIEKMPAHMAGARKASMHCAVISPRRDRWRKRKARAECTFGSRSMPSTARAPRTAPATSPRAAGSCPRQSDYFGRGPNDPGVDGFRSCGQTAGRAFREYPHAGRSLSSRTHERTRSSPCDNSPHRSGSDAADLHRCIWAWRSQPA